MSGGTTSIPDITGPVSFSSANNVIGSAMGSGLSNGVNGNQLGVSNPGLASLSSYGGPTQTAALLAGSPAIGKAGQLTTLNGAVSASTSGTVQSITVASGTAGTIASTPGSYVIQIDSEQMLVTSVNLSTATLTVVRGYNSTPAGSHNSGASVFLASDQRGLSRPTTASDVGAFQTQGSTSQVVVTTLSDSPAHTGLSLRDAINLANAAAGAGTAVTITFAAGLSGTISMTPGALSVSGGTAGITINGGNQITLDGLGSFEGFTTSGIVTITGFTIIPYAARTGTSSSNNWNSRFNRVSI
jgi:hypothetical protein